VGKGKKSEKGKGRMVKILERISLGLFVTGKERG